MMNDGIALLGLIIIAIINLIFNTTDNSITAVAVGGIAGFIGSKQTTTNTMGNSNTKEDLGTKIL